MISAGVFLILMCACGKEKIKENNSSVYNTVTVEKKDVAIKTVSVTGEASQTPLALQNYNGAEITYYSPNEPSQETKNKLAAFSKAHNCNVKIAVGTGDVRKDLSQAQDAGIFYDIVESSNENFANTLSMDIYEPLDSLIDIKDYFDPAVSENCGLSQSVSSRFTIEDKVYAVGSAQSVDYYVIYYNKYLFDKAGLGDPYSLWTGGRWSFLAFEFMNTVTSYASGTAFLQLPELSEWFNLKANDTIRFSEGTFKNDFYSEQTLLSAEGYQQLIYGDKPMSIPKSGKNSFKNGKAYSAIGKFSDYSALCDQIQKSEAFDEDLLNFGIVPLPDDINPSGSQSASTVRSYAAMKGSANPSAAPCYALFESRIEDQTDEKSAVAAGISDYLKNSFNLNGYVPQLEFVNSEEGVGISDILNSAGMEIRDGVSYTTALASRFSAAEYVINSSLQNKND